MLYKVTPTMPSVEELGRKEREPGQPRKRRKSAVFDGDGQEVLITLMCLKCRKMKPLAQFGLRKMADGAIRNQPWCRTCRGAAGAKKTQSENVGDAAASSANGAHVAAPESAPIEAAEPVAEFLTS